MKKNLSGFLCLIMVANFLAFISAPTLVLADTADEIRQQLEPIRTNAYNSSQADETTLAVTVAEIIKIVLSFLGVIFIVLIIYAGFLWMLSAGNEERISKAKSIIISAIIGVAIILAAYAITQFVISNLLKATID